MPALRSRLLLLLRTSVLTLMLLGVAMKPMLSSLCETHALADAFAWSSHLADPSQESQHRHGSLDTHAVDNAHSDGGHGLLHEDDSGSAYADLASVVILPAPYYPRVRLVSIEPAPVPAQPVSQPFRPPIA